MAATGRLWQARIEVSRQQVAVFEPAIAAYCPTVVQLERDNGPTAIEGLFTASPDRASIEVALSLAGTAAGIAPPRLTIEAIDNRDWLRENREQFAPFSVGGFYIHDGDVSRPAPANEIALRIDAATAFGSGRHQSTAGCLIALSRLRRRRFRNVLDLGTGTGILAIAASKLWRARALATDIDDEAVAVARLNARLNGVTPRVRAVRSNGYTSSLIRSRRPYDLVLANILARPLRRLARDTGGVVAAGGVIVLAGFVTGSVGDVLAAHRAAGFHLLDQVMLDDWVTLLLRRGRS